MALPVARSRKLARPISPHAWKRYSGLGVAAGVAHFLLRGEQARGAVYLAIAVSGVVAVLVGVARNRPTPRRPWYLFAGGLAAFLAGDLVFYFYKLVRHVDRPFPSVADGFYLASYPLLVAGLLAVIRRRNPGGDRAGLIDASIVATALGLVVEVYLITPNLVGAGTPWMERAISAAYPLADVALLAVTARLALGAGTRQTPDYLLGLAILGLLAADTAYGVIQLTGSFQLGTPFDAGWMAFYLFWGAAALHPSMPTMSDSGRVAEAGPDRPPLVVLAGVVLIAPTVLAVQSFTGSYRDLPVITAASVVLFVLVVARIGGLMASLESTAARERSLRSAAAALVAAPDRPGIVTAAVDAARRLVGPSAAVVRMGMWSPADVVAAARGGGPDGTDGTDGATPPPAVPPPGHGAGDYRAPLGLREFDALVRDPLGLGRPALTTVVAPVVVQEELQGAIVVASDEPLPPGVHYGLDTLGSQVALALESAALAQDLHHRQGEARFASLVRNSTDVICVVETDSTIRYITPSVRPVLGYDVDALVGTRLVELINPGHRPRAMTFLDEAGMVAGTGAPVELLVRRPDRSWVDVEAVGNNLMSDPTVGGIVVTLHDISERKAFERQLTHQAFHDSLTGLPNRALFNDRVGHALSRRRPVQWSVAVMVLDLDDFKTVNDSLGHAAGDELIRAVAEAIVGCLRPGDTTARLGGDEFAVLIEWERSRQATFAAAQRILDALDQPFAIEGKEVEVHASLGVAFADDDTAGCPELLRNADVAMYTAKAQNRGAYVVFERSMYEAALQRLDLKADLQRALEQDELVLYYQPIVELVTERVVGFEALVRWEHPERGLLAPVHFVPLAEETGLIVPLGRWVIERACRQARHWQAAGGLSTSVNLSRRQLADPRLLEDVANVLCETGLPPSSVVFEVTESVIMHDVAGTVRTLEGLRSLGVGLSIDDFGTGYSSLASLRQLPVDELKIDKAFVDGVATSMEDGVLVGTIVELARGLRLVTVAEGIEDRAQLERLRSLRCALGQGFLFSKPLPVDEAVALLHRGHPSRFAGVPGLRNGLR